MRTCLSGCLVSVLFSIRGLLGGRYCAAIEAARRLEEIHQESRDGYVCGNFFLVYGVMLPMFWAVIGAVVGLVTGLALSLICSLLFPPSAEDVLAHSLRRD